MIKKVKSLQLNKIIKEGISFLSALFHHIRPYYIGLFLFFHFKDLMIVYELAMIKYMEKKGEICYEISIYFFVYRR